MKLFDKQSLALLVSVVTINVLCIIAVSYAYFTTQIKGNDAAGPITVVMGSMKIKYEDSDLVSLNDALPADYLTNKFRITNTGTLDATYNLKIDVIENNFRDKGDLEYTLRRNGEPVDSGTLPYTDGYILTNVTIPSEEIHNYELEVKFKEDLVDKNQNDNKNRKVDFKIVVDSNEEAEKYVYKPLYKDNSGANIPELYQGMIPIKYEDVNEDGTNEIVIADVTEEWYNYNEHEWANAVLIDHTNKEVMDKFYKEDGTLKSGDIVTTDDVLQMYVWIPRYKYQLFNANNELVPEQMINTIFETGEDTTGNVSCEYINQGNGRIEEKCINAENGEWYTHPAFTFGDTELGGIWVSKFESSETVDNLKIIPNAISLRALTVSTMFNASRNIELKSASRYNLNKEEIDTHMMKNSEWGAVAYLMQSQYGRCIDGKCNEVWKNSNSNYVTGCGGESINPKKSEICNDWLSTNGKHTSTTDDVYGIYDMSGGSYEYVMGNMVNLDGTFYSSKSEFEESIEILKPDIKYYDAYSNGDDINDVIRGHLGDATRETINWTSINYRYFPFLDNSWSSRGGANFSSATGRLWGTGYNTGEALIDTSFRIVLTAQDGVD